MGLGPHPRLRPISPRDALASPPRARSSHELALARGVHGQAPPEIRRGFSNQGSLGFRLPTSLRRAGPVLAGSRMRELVPVFDPLEHLLSRNRGAAGRNPTITFDSASSDPALSRKSSKPEIPSNAALARAALPTPDRQGGGGRTVRRPRRPSTSCVRACLRRSRTTPCSEEPPGSIGLPDCLRGPRAWGSGPLLPPFREEGWDPLHPRCFPPPNHLCRVPWTRVQRFELGCRVLHRLSPACGEPATPFSCPSPRVP